MKKSGGLSLPIYIIYFVLGLGLTIYHFIQMQNTEGWEPLGHMFVMIFFGIIAAIGLVAIILKLIHMATGWGFFGLICILFDVAVVGASLYIFVINTASANLTGFLWLVGMVILAVVSVISNILSVFRN